MTKNQKKSKKNKKIRKFKFYDLNYAYSGQNIYQYKIVY